MSNEQGPVRRFRDYHLDIDPDEKPVEKAPLMDSDAYTPEDFGSSAEGTNADTTPSSNQGENK